MTAATLQHRPAQARRGTGVGGGQFKAHARAETNLDLMGSAATCRLCPSCREAQDPDLSFEERSTLSETCARSTGRGPCALNPQDCGCPPGASH
ncbi:hypothetical protein [Nocardioides sp. Leaf285]|uniref:hypothetical protein n=1 Tax=Nocardioides sp. Leaf285 TaxID=1736322 RepID=UPI0007028A36|nr:hypothetical protein [Nocardioides sp. Leaf285]KQP62888.1 hypothetical protein ASF47_17910 [Nocardioides sp. Leaf285]